MWIDNMPPLKKFMSKYIDGGLYIPVESLHGCHEPATEHIAFGFYEGIQPVHPIGY
jgi:hypothetical protein